MRRFNIKVNRACAFCKFWYDPTNSAIEPKAPASGVWEYDESVKKPCMKPHSTMKRMSWACCNEYVCKIEH